MKKIIPVCLFLIFLAFPALAQTLEWDNTDPGNVAGYIMYFSDDPATPGKWWKTIVGEENTSITFAELHVPFGVECEFYVTAYNDVGKSGGSNHVTEVRQPFAPPTDHLPIVSLGPLEPSNLKKE